MLEWDEESAVKKYNEVLETSQYQRAALETMCGLWDLMGWAADQWMGVGRGGGGGIAIKQLRANYDIATNDVRISMNKMREVIKQIDSRTAPRELEWTVIPNTESPRHRSVAQVGHKVLDLFLTRGSMALKKLRDNNLARLTRGMNVIRRCMMPREDGLELQDPMGKPLMGEDGKPVVLQGGYDHWWDLVSLPEIVRDPSATTWRFDDDEFIGHEKPCPVSKIEAMIPGFKAPEGLKTTMGELLQFQGDVWRATMGRAGTGMSVSESKQPGVMYCEAWYRGKGWKWAYHLVGWRDSGATEPAGRGMNVISFGANGYHGLPLHPFVFDAPPGSSRAMGLSEQLTPAQMMENMSKTGLLRLMLDAGGRYIIDRSGLVDKKWEDILRSRWKPFIVNGPQAMKSIDRVSAAQLDPAMFYAMTHSTEEFNSAAGMADVLRGVSSKRGESAMALKVKVGQAEGTMLKRVDDDEFEVEALLTGTLADLGGTASLEELQTTLGHEFGPTEIAAFLATDWDSSAPGVKIAHDSLRPSPPEESLVKYANAVNAQMMDGQKARWAHMIRSGEGLDPIEQEEWKYQESEIRQMRAGGTPVVRFWHDHELHITVCRREMAQPRFDNYPPEIQEAIEEHASQHWDMLQQLVQRKSGPQQPQGTQDESMQVAPAGVGGEPSPEPPTTSGPRVLPDMAMGGQGVGPGM